MLKKTLIPALAVCLSLSLMGCGGSDTDVSTEASTAVTETSTEGETRFGIPIPTTEEPATEEETEQKTVQEPETEPEPNDTQAETAVPTDADVPAVDISAEAKAIREMISGYSANDGYGYAARYLALRSGPGTSNKMLDTIPYSSFCKVLGKSGNWTKVEYEGTVGYCSSYYLLSQHIANFDDGTKGDSGFVQSYDNASQMWTKKINKILSLVPENILKNFSESDWSYYAMGSDIGTFYNMSSGITGITDFTNHVIMIECSDQGLDNSVLHEMGHYLDYVCGYPSQTKEFEALYRQEAGKLDSAYKDNAKDFFAEAFRQILIDETKCPEGTKDFVKAYMEMPR